MSLYVMGVRFLYNNQHTEEEKKLADEIRKDINEGKKSIEINAKRRRLNRLYAKRREEPILDLSPLEVN